ncbi:MAG: hypothetical protein ACQETD_09695 [Pseudomonadota bacterium]
MDTYTTPKFQEEFSAKLPSMALLTGLGWEFVPPAEALARVIGVSTERHSLKQMPRHPRMLVAGVEPLETWIPAKTMPE